MVPLRTRINLIVPKKKCGVDFSVVLFQEKPIDFSEIKLPESIEEFFTKKEFEKMCDLDRLHFKNVRLNYEMMLAIGEFQI